MRSTWIAQRTSPIGGRKFVIVREYDFAWTARSTDSFPLPIGPTTTFQTGLGFSPPPASRTTCASTVRLVKPSCPDYYQRLEQLLQARGRWVNANSANGARPPEADADPLAEQPGLRACYDAAARGVSVSGERAGQPTLRLVLPPEPRRRACPIGSPPVPRELEARPLHFPPFRRGGAGTRARA